MSSEKNSSPNNSVPTFREYYDGTLYGALSWQQLAALWSKVTADSEADSGWYIYAVGQGVPITTASKPLLQRFISETDALLRRDHREDYCGIVYADDLEKPNFVKIFDPHKLGSSCGSSANPPAPGWILSRVPPTEIKSKEIVPEQRKRWLAAIFQS